MHAESEKWALDHVPPARGSVIEVGGMDVNGNIRHLFDAVDSYICVDIAEGPGVDIVAPFEAWALMQDSGTADLVVCFEVLEHAPHWWGIVQGACHLLKPGGRFVGTCATVARAMHSAWGSWEMQPDEWYQNVSPQDLSSAFLTSSFADWTINVTRDSMDIRWEAIR